MPDVRKTQFQAVRTILVKIGSKSLSGNLWNQVAEQVHKIKNNSTTERRFVFVTSGAIALGMSKLGMKTRPKDVAHLQAAAAAGQSLLMQKYEEAFEQFGQHVAQVLLTHADLGNRNRVNNARNALQALLDKNVIPVINENDAVAVEEIKFGDNDQLSSMVVPLVDANLLVLLSDVDGLLDETGNRISVVTNIEKEALPFAGESASGVGTGGMTSKVLAARAATWAGAHVVIARAKEPEILKQIVEGHDVGTWFPAAKRKLSARKHWILFTLRPKGAVIVDQGAEIAIVEQNRSVLSVGAIGIRGTFYPGDAIDIVNVSGRIIARGLSELSSAAMGHDAFYKELPKGTVLIHKDNLVFIP